ncbi:PspC domain-containing protein [Kitasatospora sp. GP82]|uniref:PspC domain-containing protein n=1 Tax=Kitasatospora sp. GP82 TaxID=3035089 RepID=UPI0024741DFE|nr:PspC domain-containing protein [Kitasatospora sp. GP82]MDH6124222.1 phage shock protein PspC (stress-responsive transcriptional regulator) [Kitasatospora sp. GP82]
MTDEQSTADQEAAATRPEQRPPLTRSERHRVVAGVCGGLGRHLDIDPVVFRVVTAVLCLSGGLGLFLYGLAWLIVPREPVEGRPGRTELQRVLTGRVDGQSVGAVLLTVIGTGVFFSSMGDGGQMFPFLLLGGMIFMAVRYDPERRRRAKGLGRHHGSGGPYDRLAEGPDGHFDWSAWGQRFAQDFKTEWQDRKVEWDSRKAQWDTRKASWDGQLRVNLSKEAGPTGDPGDPPPMDESEQLAREQHARARAEGTVPADTPAPGSSGYLWDPRHPERNPYAAHTPPPGAPLPLGAPAQAWWQRADLPEGDPLRKTGPASGAAAGAATVTRPRRHRSFLGPLGLLLAGGAGALAWWVPYLQGSTVRLSTVVAATLLGLGVALLIAAKFGRARGLVIPALLLTVLLTGISGSGATVQSAFGNRDWAPASAAEMQSDYTLGAGDAQLDLSGLDPAGGTLSTTVRVGMGDLLVTVPAGVDVRLTLRNAVGNVQMPNGESASGVGNSREYQLHPANGRASKGTLDLTVKLGLGDIQVVQA